jgi:hypothetical protein
LLSEVLPLSKPISTASLTRQVHKVARRLEAELGEEQVVFIEGCQQQWYELPEPAEPIVMGIDGGYVRARSAEQRCDGNFDVIVGKSLAGQGDSKCFGFVTSYDTKPKRRIFESLRKQGMQPNQQVTFLSDGGDNVRQLQLYLHPQSEFLLDWFHLTMRLTVMRQMVKGFPADFKLGETTPSQLDKELERLKWYLWYGNLYKALTIASDLHFELETLGDGKPEVSKLTKTLEDFNRYITLNKAYIVNYGERYRNGERISTGFVESSVNQIISKRFVKRQQMRWTRQGTHLLLQVRVQVLNQQWQAVFERWYPGLKQSEPVDQLRLAA